MAVLNEMSQKYNSSKAIFRKASKNYALIDQIKKKFSKNKIKCFKYNYNIDANVQNWRQFESYMQLSKDGTEINIVNLKPIIKEEYVLEADPNEVERLRMENLEIQANASVDEEVEFNKKNSSASCKLEDITGIVYGGFSSRFWMLRKHVNSVDMKTIQDSDMPFFSW